MRQRRFVIHHSYAHVARRFQGRAVRQQRAQTQAVLIETTCVVGFFREIYVGK